MTAIQDALSTLVPNADRNLTPANIGGVGFGSGTRTALALVRFVPQAEFTLLRIDPEAPFQLLEAARYIQGDDFLPYSLLVRANELTAARESLRQKQAVLLAERAAVLDTFAIDQKTLDRRDAYFKSQASFDQQEKDLQDRESRYLKLIADLKALHGIRLVINDLFWTEGHPAEGASTLARFFNDTPFRAASWFQAGGLLPGQVWTVSRDLDGNDVWNSPGPMYSGGRPVDVELDFRFSAHESVATADCGDPSHHVQGGPRSRRNRPPLPVIRWPRFAWLSAPSAIRRVSRDRQLELTAVSCCNGSIKRAIRPPTNKPWNSQSSSLAVMHSVEGRAPTSGPRRSWNFR